MSEMSADEIMNEVRKQHWELNNARYRPDATLFISEDCWASLLNEMPYEVVNNATASAPTRGLMGYTTIVVKDVEQYIELKENAGYGGRVGVVSYFDEWGDV